MTDNLDAWADLYIFVPSVTFTDDEPHYLQIYFAKDTLDDTKTVLLRRILRDIGHKITKWESWVDVRDGLTTKDIFTTDVTKADTEGNKFLSIVEECEELSPSLAHNNSSPSSDDSLSQQSDSSEEEPSPLPAL